MVRLRANKVPNIVTICRLPTTRSSGPIKIVTIYKYRGKRTNPYTQTGDHVPRAYVIVVWLHWTWTSESFTQVATEPGVFKLVPFLRVFSAGETAEEMELYKSRLLRMEIHALELRQSGCDFINLSWSFRVVLFSLRPLQQLHLKSFRNSNRSIRFIFPSSRCLRRPRMLGPTESRERRPARTDRPNGSN